LMATVAAGWRDSFPPHHVRCEAVVNGPELCTCRTVPGASVGRSHAGEQASPCWNASVMWRNLVPQITGFG